MQELAKDCYECMLDAGANFASSPSRVLIHCLDPVLVCEKIAYTRIDKIISITDVINNTITGIKRELGAFKLGGNIEKDILGHHTFETVFGFQFSGFRLI